MDRIERIYALHETLSGRRTPAPRSVLTERLRCSNATLFRIIQYMREVLHAPIKTYKEPGGYGYEPMANGGSYELPGVWFTATELQALMLISQLLQTLHPSLMRDRLGTVSRKISALIKDKRIGLPDAHHRIRVLGMASRAAGPHFQAVAGATLQRRKLHIHFHNRERNDITERTISPQRIVHYRDNWYLDAWCELRNELRSFSVDQIQHASTLTTKAVNIANKQLDAHYASAYGIFAGTADKTAVLHFSPVRARWVADERWHPMQKTRWLENGLFELTIPYRNDRELVMDILRHGNDVVVKSPQSLRDAITRQLNAALKQYEKDTI